MKKKLHNNHKPNSFIAFSLAFVIFAEIFFGFSMAVATFGILPFSMELIGVLPSVFSVLLSAFLVLLARRILQNHCVIQILLSGVILVVYRFFSMPFASYSANGVFLGILAGSLLAVQVVYLSSEYRDGVFFKKSGIWYLSGVLLGILLK